MADSKIREVAILKFIHLFKINFLIIENVFPQSNDKKNEVLYGEGQCL
jgi:hypothetical protein